jgi:virulence factor
MNIQRLIRLYKYYRKKALLTNITRTYKYKYAFIGVGQHSLSTFYPILSFLNVPLKYILTHKTTLGKQIASHFSNAEAISDYKQVLNDPEISGIFICNAPHLHYDLAYQALKSQKNILIEKPVCYSADQLNQLITVCKTHCLAGMQKRYCVVNEIIKNRYSNPFHYQARYAIGSYPEGNPVYEIFIHALDNLSFLFGNAKFTYVKKIKNSNGVLINLQIEHDNGVHGTIELSTMHHWQQPIDSLRLNISNSEVTVNYPDYIEETQNEKSILGIPLDKIFHASVKKNIIYQNTNLITTLEKNILFEAGFYNEVKEFIKLVEDDEPNSVYAPSSIQKLVNTYQLLDSINY